VSSSIRRNSCNENNLLKNVTLLTILRAIDPVERSEHHATAGLFAENGPQVFCQVAADWQYTIDRWGEFDFPAFIPAGPNEANAVRVDDEAAVNTNETKG
jgi:hypothetical protein